MTPAWSDTFNHRDARHDVAGTAKGGFDYRRASVNRKFDITHTRVVHGNTTIRLNATLRSASMHGVEGRSLDFKMKTNTDTYFGSWQQYHGEFQVDLLDDTTGQEVTCNSMRTGKHHRTISLSLERTCVGDPRWIKVGVSVAGHRGDRAFYDLAQSDSWKDSEYKHLSRRLHPSM